MELPGYRAWCVTESFAQLDLEALIDNTNPLQSAFRKVEDFEGVALVALETAAGIECFVLRTLHATVPIYVAIAGDGAHVSWDFLHCARAVPFAANLAACKRFILTGQPFHGDTIISGVSVLGGGAAARLGAEGATIYPAEPIAIYEESTLVPGADAAETFIDLIANQIRRRTSQADMVALELSGGLDSSCVAIATDRVDGLSVQTYGLLHAGVAGDQQRLRREELVHRYRFTDTTLPSEQSSPFTAFVGETRSRRKVPCDELFRAGIDGCLDILSKHIDVVITGIGGDELTLLPEADATTVLDETTEALLGARLPPPVDLPTLPIASAVDAAFCRSDMFLSRGIWPVNPLLAAEVVQFSQALPRAMKEGRMLNKVALAKERLSDFFLFPVYRENFRVVYDNDLHTFDMAGYFENALLQSLGIIRMPVLLDAHRGFVNTGKSAIPRVCFANAVRLEHVLRDLHDAN
ncbi:asparagine synthase-related protein [Mesorhizobium amorphae]|uniref:asparagine synthase-related protein n=1 Tax=Mesorhizobium amorphae TaxID=71433 RepID=UPI001183D623|nr:asparagine synthase-related protein [Mesorhizobium amorphae]